MRKNKLKEIFKEGKTAVNGWLQIPNTFTALLHGFKSTASTSAQPTQSFTHLSCNKRCN